MTEPTLFPADPPVTKSAILSVDGLYRYLLTRSWERGRTVTWIMLNPSTADHELDDPTIRRCMSFARAWGYAGVDVVNLYAWRTKSPRALFAAEEHHDTVGVDNDLHIREVLTRARSTSSPVIAAWGTHGDKARVREVRRIAHNADVDLTCLGVTKDGHPRHPLYVKGDTALTTWRP